MRERKIVKYGNGYFISLFKIDMKDKGYKEGSIVDIDDLKPIEEKRENQNI